MKSFKVYLLRSDWPVFYAVLWVRAAHSRLLFYDDLIETNELIIMKANQRMNV